MIKQIADLVQECGVCGFDPANRNDTITFSVEEFDHFTRRFAFLTLKTLIELEHCQRTEQNNRDPSLR